MYVEKNLYQILIEKNIVLRNVVKYEKQDMTQQGILKNQELKYVENAEMNLKCIDDTIIYVEIV